MAVLRTPIERFGIACAVALTASCAQPVPVAQAPRLGIPVADHDIAALRWNVFPDGRGLPDGSGDVASGERLFAQHCAACHGRDGRGGSAEELAGAQRPLTVPHPDKTIGSYWPHATTLFDYIRRAKPMTAPATLNADEVYALCAWLLYLNGVLERDATLDAHSLPAVRMPNRDGFIWIEAVP